MSASTDRPGHRLGVLCAAALTLTAMPVAGASAATVSSGQLAWSQTNVYDTSAPAGTNRTWIGYVTRFAAGTTQPTGRATGPTVVAANGGAQTFLHPLRSGTYDPVTGSGSVQLDGGVSYSSTAHGFTITVEDPRIDFNGGTGQLFAVGRGSTSKGAAAYDRSQPVFDLDLSSATVTHEGTKHTYRGIVPRIATEDYVFPKTYAKGAGPERTPNTFGCSKGTR